MSGGGVDVLIVDLYKYITSVTLKVISFGFSKTSFTSNNIRVYIFSNYSIQTSNAMLINFLDKFTK